MNVTFHKTEIITTVQSYSTIIVTAIVTCSGKVD